MDINGIKGVTPVLAAERSVREPLVPQGSKREESQVTLLGQQAEGHAHLQSTEQRQPVEEAVSSIKQFAQSIQRNLNFALDDSSGRVVVKVTDGVSGEVIRQIPSEDALRLAESLEEARSLLFKAEA
ncbi:flagellar protein FlaG [Pseudomonas sp. SJZ079]|uniref:flagellar protein FlaG n=1 Tax=Pseudomonas sp. SJZ079 TaxID=2572887 RepID=UPI00119BD519|nr:flagellar protein FlaG [Pseudomonas sp. SJZ079]TWC42976.1 flagellar protein FlaG [Pseudomonas sp. SJZ079]